MTAKTGSNLQGGDHTARSEAARLMGAARTPAKVEASRANMAKATEARRGKPLSEAHSAALRTAQAARRERERQERADAGLSLDFEEKPKRPRGRPRKAPTDGALRAQDGQTPSEGRETA